MCRVMIPKVGGAPDEKEEVVVPEAVFCATPFANEGEKLLLDESVKPRPDAAPFRGQSQSLFWVTPYRDRDGKLRFQAQYAH